MVVRAGPYHMPPPPQELPWGEETLVNRARIFRELHASLGLRGLAVLAPRAATDDKAVADSVRQFWATLAGRPEAEKF